MNKDTIRQILVVLATLATIGVNALASALPLNGQTTGEISDRFDVFFVPAGYVFSIWGLIYLALLAYSVFQALPAQAQDARLRSIGYLYILSAVANMAWIFLWHYEFFPFSVVAMLALLGLLTAILSAPGYRPRAGLLGHEMVRPPPIQHLPGLDYGGYHRQYHFRALFPGVEWLGNQPRSLDFDHACRGPWSSARPSA